MSEKAIEQFHPRQYPDVLNPLAEDCPPWTRHAQYLKEQEDIWEHAAVLSECDCNDCHLERLCPYKFKHDEDSQKGCVKRLHDDLLRPLADGMTDHEKMIVMMMDAKSQLERIVAINKWLWESARNKIKESLEYNALSCEIHALTVAIQEINFRIKRARNGEFTYNETNFTGLE